MTRDDFCKRVYDFCDEVMDLRGELLELEDAVEYVYREAFDIERELGEMESDEDDER